jgi:hypothetical protein
VSNGQRIGLPVASFMVYIVVGLPDISHISSHRALNQKAALLHMQKGERRDPAGQPVPVPGQLGNVSVPSTSP